MGSSYDFDPSYSMAKSIICRSRTRNSKHINHKEQLPKQTFFSKNKQKDVDNLIGLWILQIDVFLIDE